MNALFVTILDLVRTCQFSIRQNLPTYNGTLISERELVFMYLVRLFVNAVSPITPDAVPMLLGTVHYIRE